jgi:hypothetical protein
MMKTMNSIAGQGVNHRHGAAYGEDLQRRHAAEEAFSWGAFSWLKISGLEY